MDTSVDQIHEIYILTFSIQDDCKEEDDDAAVDDDGKMLFYV